MNSNIILRKARHKGIHIISALPQEWDNEKHHNLHYCGVGKVNATMKTMEVIADCVPNLIINYGTAGAAREYNPYRDAHIKGLVDCQEFVQRDMDATDLGFKEGETPYEENSQLILRGENPGIINYGFVCGTGDTFVGGSEFVMTYDDTEVLDVVDMEAYAIAKVCDRYDTRFMCLKYITDNADKEAADSWKNNVNKGRKEFLELLERML